MTWNKLEQKLIEVALLPITRYDIEIREDVDKIGYYAVPQKRLDSCPLCPHSEGGVQ